METNNKTDKQRSFKTNVMPFLILAAVLVVSTVVLYFVVQLIVN